MAFFFGFLMFVVAMFLILLILVQRGKGGGLTGALGGMGGESAFGSKAGDLFTRITIGAAILWILLCMLSIRMLSSPVEHIKMEADAETSIEAFPDNTPEKPDAAGASTAEKPDAAPASGDSLAPSAEAPEDN